MTHSYAQHVTREYILGWLVKDAAAIRADRHRSFKSG